MLQNKDDSTNIKSSYHISVHIWEKVQQIETNPSNNYYIATEKLEKEGERPFGILPFSKIRFDGQFDCEFNGIRRCVQ